ncbi:endonuclease domain-containing protein [Labilibaculum sp. DW002]|uniref:Endonuclease domain-containing protein n=1 Tax=Paralabilibaculum antarcticum TaxID=2912572 RepID=A0ABT5VX60_9BACT|nr:endonuclease domain-containing protein [Labilibaculum sp. DW002]MDE5420010.1 endonuclease domain-containing protein [Labilibaculum sp. DW002]
MKYQELKEIKNKLRANTTKSEELLWKHIRKRQLLGRKFIRQHVIVYESYNDEYFFFIPDFYCDAEKLALELDGKIHDFTKNKDGKRDEILRSQRIQVIRIKNEELDNIEKVKEKIISNFQLDNNNPIFHR